MIHIFASELQTKNVIDQQAADLAAKTAIVSTLCTQGSWQKAYAAMKDIEDLSASLHGNLQELRTFQEP